LLTRAAVEVGAFAKALRHKETEYSSAQSDKDLQKVVSDRCGLIEIYNNLGHTVSAEGTLTDVVVRMADKSVAREVKEQYNETLLLLPEALKAYKNAAEKLPGGIDLSTVDACSEARGKQLHKARARANGGRERALGGVNGVGPPAAGGPPGVHVMNPPRNADGTLQTPTTDEEFNATSLPEQDRDLKWFLTLAQLRVLDSLGEWRVMEDMAHDAWTQTDGNNAARASLAVDGRACSVAFDLSEWGQFKERVEHIHGTNDWDEHFYKSLLCVQEGKEDASKLADASRHIQRAMEILDAGLRTRAAEGYPRAYGDFLNAQHLVELDEMVRCIRVGMPAAGKKRLKDLWGARLNDAKEDQHTWYRLLMIRSLLLNPMENKDQWLKFATKCRKNRRLPMATEALRKLVGHIADTHGVAGEGRGVDAKSCAGRLLAGEDGKFLPVKEWTAESMLAIPERAVQFACIKHLWASDEQGTAFQALKGCFLNDAEMRPSVPPQFGLLRGEEDVGLQAEILLKLAKWSDRIISRPALAGGASDASPPRPAESLAYAKKATEWSPVWYKSWHFWAALNVKQAEKAVRSLEERRDAHSASSASRTRAARTSLDFDSKLPPMNDGIVKQLTCAIDGYFNAIKYGGKTGLEDVLTLLRLWFRYGSDPALSDVFNRGFLQSAPDCWLEVVPQLIARLYTPHVLVRKGIEKLLIRVGLAHPHAAVYPLTVAENTPGRSKAQEDRRKSACAVLTRMRGQHKAIVEQAKLVAVELNRVAILEHEKWYDRIEEASRLYYSEHDVIGMLDALRSLHDAMANQAPETECEESFRRDYGADLTRADQYGREFLTGYKARLNDGTDDPAELQRQQGLIERAWELYYQVFRRIQRQQGSMNSLDMRSVSPALQRCKDMVLAIPGKYRPFGDDPVKIARFDPRLDVMQSKMRPRKLDMIGSDGRPYGFLLKGHDDLRQDERVMQVFGLINQHLAQSGERSVRQGAQLKRYAVIVLSSNAGLIEWVPDCDTMHALVKTFRENRRVMPNVEHKVMLRVAPEPERLPLLHKVDLFEFMLQNTGGRDIARVLWLRSRNSEMWLDRRTNFARTLATTSMAGYILGLGDRHPSNIMIERETGKIMHIDFGDCFEVAMRRDKYPEKVPFRLTRMLVHALEPCGVRGHFRHMAVGMMRVLRHENACKAMESMMEAFVFDPLIRQKLLDAAELETGSTDRAPADSPTGGGVTPSGRIAEQYAQGGSLAEVLRMETGGPAVADEDVMAHQGPTPSQQSRSRRESVIGRDGELSAQFAALANDRAREAIGRVLAKLSGRDFEDSAQPLSVEDQVDRLVDEAQNVEHLCQLFPGWVASW
jgi:serine/threonine-protein kinase mTOR